jgi:hypothetical protein
MKSIFQILMIAAVSALPGELGAAAPSATEAAEAVSPATNKEVAAEVNVHFFDFDNAKMLYKDNFEQYRADREAQAQGLPDNNCKLAESDNYYGAQQCKFSWECRGARMCERGGWCNGYDGCEETALPMQANGLLPDH